MKKSIWLIVIFLIFQSCAEIMQADCGVDNPLEDLEWLKAETENSNRSGFIYLVQGKYKGRTVFFFNGCDPLQLTMAAIQDCRGEIIQEASVNDVRDQRVIWKPKNSACNLD
ncbi:hypothetical protein SAMN03080617_02122 [Algoriphagus alkaliphilus]|uniref:Uncharacterized protein n=1 Tax=Algoriphagus alkaliphilus TaxID=279824 RepID=A0A1G5Y0F8_9BACT|nr:hypothetical protein [Algoriphagus alkaliphilus]MBA4300645.1 hypothetical protein [Cyclobacterium sp.]SDA75940.1 hypothetical protein SAMN03080617_02122 [Algoriphagus alkaliphilus]